jgi:hypothetical protein
MLQATNCVPAHAAHPAAEKARPFNIQAGAAIMLVSIRFPMAISQERESLWLAHENNENILAET